MIALAFATAHVALSVLATILVGVMCFSLPPTVVFMSWSRGVPVERWPRIRQGATRAAWAVFLVLVAAIWWRG